MTVISLYSVLLYVLYTGTMYIVPWYGVGYVTVMPDIYDFIRWYLDEEVDAKTEGSVCGLHVPKYTPGPHSSRQSRA